MPHIEICPVAENHQIHDSHQLLIEGNMTPAAKRKEPACDVADAENHAPTANLAPALVKRRFVPPAMACPAGQTPKQPLSVTQGRPQQPWRSNASTPKSASAAKPAATSNEPAHYYTVLYTKKSNKVTTNADPALQHGQRQLTMLASLLTLQSLLCRNGKTRHFQTVGMACS